MLDETKRFYGVEVSRTFRNIRTLFDLSHKAVLDVGCGYGQYLKHFGQGSVGITTAQEEVIYGSAHNLKIVFGNAEHLNSDIGAGFKAIWANNVFEHLLSPHAFLMRLKQFAAPEAMIIIGVPVVPKIVWFTHMRWFRGTLASNHINFFTHTTLGLTVERAGWDVQTVRPFIFKNKFLDILVRPFAPHMYVVAENIAYFQYPEKKVHEWINDEYYNDLLAITHQQK